MKVIAGLLAPWLFLILFQPLSAQTLTPEQVLGKMEQANRTSPFLQASVQKTKYTSVLAKTGDPQPGKIWISSPANAARRIKIDFEKPLRELFLVDKGAITHYYPGEKTGDTKPLTRDDQAEGECILFGLCQPGPRIKENYNIRVAGAEALDGVQTTRLELKPKDPSRTAGFAMIELWLDSTKWHAIQTRVTETNKNYVNYKFSKFQTGKIADSVFDLNLPRDAAISKHK